MSTRSTTAHLTTAKHEYIKQHIVYDGSNRMVEIYEARANVGNGDPCLKTEYQYAGTSTRVTGMKESEGTWDSAWDF